MTNDETCVRDLGEGLVLRRATLNDTEALVDFNARVHSDEGWDAPEAGIGVWVRDLMTRPHPTFVVGDFLVVEDTATGTIVSSSNLISQTWSYAGIPFGVGRPELVGTHPDYRRRGLVRAQFEVLHRWSAERGELVQAITGIPWYYRQFGYEMTVDMHGGRRGPVSAIPALKEGQDEPHRVRPAMPVDLDFIAGVAAQASARDLLSCVRDPDLWRYELDGRTLQSMNARKLCIIETPTGEAVGFLAHPPTPWWGSLYLTSFEVLRGVSWWAVMPSVLRYLKRVGEVAGSGEAPADGRAPFETMVLGLGRVHPAYDLVEDRLPKVDDPYAWFIRVPDLPAFLQLIAPVLQRRLAASAMADHSGALLLDFYRDGVQIVFEQGRIVDVAPHPLGRESDMERRGTGAFVRFPDLTFLQVLFGYRSFTELQHAYADCGGNLEGRLLVKVLFPKQNSAIWPVS
jgi:hypothetical protein